MVIAWISETAVTPDLPTESGYRYTLNWCHDDQPQRMRTRSGQSLWSIPYPQELNDIPMIMARQLDGRDFADMVIDNPDEMLLQSQQQALVMGIALHPLLLASRIACVTCAALWNMLRAPENAAQYG